MGVRMVQMIPASIDSGKPVSEILVFNALEAVVGKTDWIVLHSLKQTVVKQGVEAETDFVVLVPNKGVVLIEAKGATAAKARGSSWTLEGVPKRAEHKDPFEQIDNAKRNIRGLLSKLGYEVNSIPFARLVWFTKISPFKADLQGGMAFEHWEIAYQEDLSKADKTIEKLLREEIQSKQNNQTVSYKPNVFKADLVADLSRSLLGEFEIKSTPANLAFERRALVRKATEEQAVVLSLLQKNNLIYFEGEAGTGKTEMLALSARELSRSRKVLFTCHNLLLAEQIREQFKGLENLDVLDTNQVLLRIIGKKDHPANAGEAWFNDELPQLALEAVSNSSDLGIYEAICIDEFQDLANRPVAFTALLGLLTNKFRPFKVLMAGDDEQQIMNSGTPVRSFDLAKKTFPNLVHVTLEANCRQAPGLSKAIHKLLNMPSTQIKHRLPQNTDWTLEIISTTSDRQSKDLYKTIQRVSRDYDYEQMRVLSIFGGKNSTAAKVLQDVDSHSSEIRNLRKLLKNEGTGEGKIRWRSIPKYKGLESDLVIITDVSNSSREWLESVSKQMRNELYVGMTRAKFHVILLVQDDLFQANRKIDGTEI